MKNLCVWTVVLALVSTSAGWGDDEAPAAKPAGKKIAPAKAKMIKALPRVGAAAPAILPAGKLATTRAYYNAKGNIGMTLASIIRLHEAVAKELNINAEDLKKLEDIQSEINTTSKELYSRHVDENGRRDYAKINEERVKIYEAAGAKIEKLLGKERFGRGKQLVYQKYGLRNAMNFPSVREELKITDEQLEKRKQDIINARNEYLKKIRTAGGNRQKMTELSKEYGKQVQDIYENFITPEQKKTWDRIVGEKFDFGQPNYQNLRQQVQQKQVQQKQGQQKQVQQRQIKG